MKTITLELSAQSCKEALEEIKKYKTEIEPKLDEVCKRLAEIGAQVAGEKFAEANAEASTTGNGGVDVTVVPIEGGGGYKIVASGEDVYFIEFGTGNSAGMFYGDGLPATSVPVYPGSYSEQNNGMYAQRGYWFYHGELFSSTPVYMPMYWAGKAIRENEKRIIEEVLGR